MSADNYILVRSHQDGFLVTQESMSADEPQDAETAYARAMGPKSIWTDGFFDDLEQAGDFVDSLYDTDYPYIEYLNNIMEIIDDYLELMEIIDDYLEEVEDDRLC